MTAGAQVVLVAAEAERDAVLPPGSGLEVSAFAELPDALAELAELRARGTPAVFLLGRPDVNRAAVLMELATRHRDVPVIVATFGEPGEPYPARRAVFRPAGSAALLDAVREAGRSAVQRSRVRTTLDRLNVRLRSEPAAADLRQQQRLLLSGLYFASILQQAHDGVFVTDRTGRVALWNPAAERLFGVPEPQIIGGWIDHACPGSAGETLLRLVRELSLQRRSAAAELTCATPHGVRDVEVSLSLVCDDQQNGIAVSGIARDVTERHQLYRELQEQARALAESNRHKDDFLAILSHELRTPLNALLGWAHILTTMPPDEERMRRGLEMIVRNAEMQRRLVEDLLDYARIAAGRLTLHRATAEVAAIVRTAVDTLRPSLERGDLRLLETYDSVQTASVDAQRLGQVVANLLGNAVKFTPPGGEVRVRVRDQKGAVEIDVADTGQGIAPEFLPYIFTEFRQADSSATRSEMGLGLGLAIARRIVELHEGRITAASDGPGRGSVFTVVIPADGTRSPG